MLHGMNRSSPKRSNTPASSAEASARGRRCIRRSNRPVTPHRVINSAEKRKAPMASLMLTPGRLVASRAAPGVDQAVSSGMR